MCLEDIQIEIKVAMKLIIIIILIIRAMHHIFYFPKDSEVSCIRDLEDSYIDTVYEQIPQEAEDPLVKSASVDIYAEKVICVSRSYLMKVLKVLRIGFCSSWLTCRLLFLVVK